MEDCRWEKITGWKLAGFSLGLAAFVALLLASEPGFIFGLDHANLLFHEAGHPFIGLFSTRLEPYGGTLGQLVFPAALAVSFWRKGQALAFGASVIWFFENWLNIARYMADARALELPLVGGGDHDWNTIFTRWNLLQYDLNFASTVKFLGWTGMVMVVLWVGGRGWWESALIRWLNLTDGGLPSGQCCGGKRRYFSSAVSARKISSRWPVVWL